MTEQPRFIVLGTGGLFTSTVIHELIKSNYKPLAYVQSGDKPLIRQATFANIALDIVKPENDLMSLLTTNNIAVYYQSQIELAELVQQLKTAFLLVACWPELLPNEVLRSVSIAALNLHPSLLPKFRGIDPVGEQLQQQDYNFGISLHLLNEVFDAGDVVLQQSLKIPSHSLSKSTIEIQAAKKGAALFIRAICSKNFNFSEPFAQQ